MIPPIANSVSMKSPVFIGIVPKVVSLDRCSDRKLLDPNSSDQSEKKLSNPDFNYQKIEKSVIFPL